MKKIFIVGSVNTDLVISSPYMPESGETLTGSDFFTARGGKGANQAVAAARLGGNVSMCAVVGDDSFGNDAIESMKKEGINVDFVRKQVSTPTGTAVIIIVNGDNRIILDKGANQYLSKDDIDTFLENANKGDIFLTQLENPIDIIGYSLKKAKEKGMYVVFNPAPGNVDIIPYLGYCDLITPNETELEILGGEAKLLDCVSTLLITLGGKGFKIVTKDYSTVYPCIKINPVDTTAAGDTLCGGLVSKLSQDIDLVEAAKFGSLAASIACLSKGAQPSIPTVEQINKFLDKLKTRSYTRFFKNE